MKKWICPVCKRVFFYYSTKGIRRTKNKHLKKHREEARKGLKGQRELIDYIYDLDYFMRTYKQIDVSTEEGFKQLIKELRGK